jgi:IS1 family transposase
MVWLYFYALTAHFGQWFRPPRARTDHWQPDQSFRHAQLVKRTHRRRLTYTLRRMAWGKRSELFEVLAANGFRQTIQTAFIERLNLTIRQGIAGLGRQNPGVGLGTALAALYRMVSLVLPSGPPA